MLSSRRPGAPGTGPLAAGMRRQAHDAAETGRPNPASPEAESRAPSRAAAECSEAGNPSTGWPGQAGASSALALGRRGRPCSRRVAPRARLGWASAALAAPMKARIRRESAPPRADGVPSGKVPGPNRARTGGVSRERSGKPWPVDRQCQDPRRARTRRPKREEPDRAPAALCRFGPLGARGIIDRPGRAGGFDRHRALFGIAVLNRSPDGDRRVLATLYSSASPAPSRSCRSGGAAPRNGPVVASFLPGVARRSALSVAASGRGFSPAHPWAAHARAQPVAVTQRRCCRGADHRRGLPRAINRDPR